MQTFHQLLFIAAVVALSWLAMLAVHELGHVAGAVATGGHVQRVVLHPLSISRTDVAPNPHPAMVVWLGPVLGCLLPLAAWPVIPRRWTFVRNLAMFFAGFCLVANGAYIAIGSLDGVGDGGEMLRTGSPVSALVALGAVAVAGGLFLWHRLGSLDRFLSDPSIVSPRSAYLVLGILLVVVAVQLTFSPG